MRKNDDNLLWLFLQLLIGLAWGIPTFGLIIGWFVAAMFIDIPLWVGLIGMPFSVILFFMSVLWMCQFSEKEEKKEKKNGL